MSKMTQVDFDLRVCQIHEQWEASRNPTDTLEEGDWWHAERLRALYDESGWSQQEIDAWIFERQQRADAKRVESGD